MACWASVAVAMEFVVAHVMAMETGGPVPHMGVQEWFIILSQGKVRGIRGMGFFRDMKVFGKSRTLIPKVIEKGIDLQDCSP